MRISDWSSDVCSSDLEAFEERHAARILAAFPCASLLRFGGEAVGIDHGHAMLALADTAPGIADLTKGQPALRGIRSEERRVGKECVSTCRSRWSTYNLTNTSIQNK